MDWVGVKEACSLLGVHEATLRRWTDQGLLQAFRTPGGHRRYRRRDIEAFMTAHQQAALPAHPAGGAGGPARVESLARRTLSETRRELRVRLSSQAWRPRYRNRENDLKASGRELVGLLIQYAAREHPKEALLEQGRATLRRYGREAAQLGLSVPETARAFLVFRQTILDAIGRSLEHPPTADPDGWRVLRRAGRFLDELLVATLEGYAEVSRATAPGGQALGARGASAAESGEPYSPGQVPSTQGAGTEVAGGGGGR